MAIVGTDGIESAPDDFPLNAQFVQIRGSEPLNTTRKDFVFPFGSRKRQSLKLFHDIQQTVEPASRLSDAVPDGQETDIRLLIDGFHRLSQCRQAAAFEPPEDVGIAPFFSPAFGQEFPFDDPSAMTQQ